MKCGILIIGSLLWDDKTEGRKDWRDHRLDVPKAVPVLVPIDYGRISSSRSNTFTMVLRSDGPLGTGFLVPCRREVVTIDDLVAEASALWKAEAPKAKRGVIGSNWGSVGVLFREGARGGFAESWGAHFKKMGTKSLAVVGSDGSLNIPWPVTEDGASEDFDLVLATATVPEDVKPSPEAVARAMLCQANGHENYFLNNVLHGIRTVSDDEIFTIIERESPNWISADEYRDAIAILRTAPDAA
ncbi:hypothetical protein E0H47_24135 [Rhizobium leguminosarum bv. viciae]|uniref:hypothetical protein n=1 Tax=Rhizobium leguminosarum TaxID=384 RepID=UPI0010409C14|nr:hypothetical protein [Rhizobium leguminosarum]TBZ35724.1 hypothetical protein E0H47_24135 [Rhizobium leguminosarum bv. viciae]